MNAEIFKIHVLSLSISTNKPLSSRAHKVPNKRNPTEVEKKKKKKEGMDM